MPKVRVRVPVDIELTDEQLEAASSVLEVVAKARDSGLAESVSKAFGKTRTAVEQWHKRRRVR